MKRLIFLAIALIIIGVILYLKFFNPAIYEIIHQNVALNAIKNYIIFLVILYFISNIVHFSYTKSSGLSNNRKDNFHYGVNNIVKLLIGVGFIVTLFGVFGVDVKSLLTSISIVAAAIAIISKEFIIDFLVGIYFSFSKGFEINDYVKLQHEKGKIIEIGMLKLKLLNDDDDIVIIPNTKVYSEEIINYTKRDIRLMSIDFQLDIKVIDSIENFEEELIVSLENFREFIEPNSYALKIVEMKKDHIDFKFQYTLKQLDRDLQRKIRRKTVREVFSHVSGKNS